MYNIIFNKYITLAISIFLIYYFLYKFNSKDQKYIKLLGLICGITGILIAISQIMKLDNLLIVPISVGMLAIFGLFTANALKMRKVPEKRVYCNIFLGIIILLLLLLIAGIILWKFGFYG